jgi:hypothetical protein
MIETRKPKPEIRRKEENPKSEPWLMQFAACLLRISGLGFPSDFWFRVSGFSKGLVN